MVVTCQLGGTVMPRGTVPRVTAMLGLVLHRRVLGVHHDQRFCHCCSFDYDQDTRSPSIGLTLALTLTLALLPVLQDPDPKWQTLEDCARKPH